MLVPLISHSPVVFWLIPAFGVRGAGYFLGTTETIFGALIFLGYWSARLGVLGALGSIVTFLGTTTIIPFLPDAWAKEAGGFPIMTLPVGFLAKDVLFLVASYDQRRAAKLNIQAAPRKKPREGDVPFGSQSISGSVGRPRDRTAPKPQTASKSRTRRSAADCSAQRHSRS
jgi:Protein of unknown function, DUF417